MKKRSVPLGHFLYFALSESVLEVKNKLPIFPKLYDINRNRVK